MLMLLVPRPHGGMRSLNSESKKRTLWLKSIQVHFPLVTNNITVAQILSHVFLHILTFLKSMCSSQKKFIVTEQMSKL